MIKKLSIIILIFITTASLFTGCVFEKKQDNKIDYELNEEGIIKPEFAEQIIKDKTLEVITALKNSDFEKLSTFVHPNKGVRFTPYTHVSIDNDVVLTKEEIKALFNNQRELMWGYYDGIGTEIVLSSKEYYEKFVYSADFANADEIGYNTVLSFGNVLENQFDVYETPIIVEYYFPGFDPQYAGMDWKSLRLVFEEFEGEWLLVGIIHNQWTI